MKILWLKIWDTVFDSDTFWSEEFSSAFSKACWDVVKSEEDERVQAGLDIIASYKAGSELGITEQTQVARAVVCIGIQAIIDEIAPVNELTDLDAQSLTDLCTFDKESGDVRAKVTEVMDANMQEKIDLMMELLQEVDYWNLDKLSCESICIFIRESLRSVQIMDYLASQGVQVYSDQSYGKQESNLILRKTLDSWEEYFYLEGQIWKVLEPITIHEDRNGVWEYFASVRFWKKWGIFRFHEDKAQRLIIGRSYAIWKYEYYLIENPISWFDLYLKEKDILLSLGFNAIGNPPRIVYDDDEIEEDDNGPKRLFFDDKAAIYVDFDGTNFGSLQNTTKDPNGTVVIESPLH